MSHSTLVSLNENVLAALDVETTGRIPWFHEVIQIAVVPLDANLEPAGMPFYTNIRPTYPERMSHEAISAHGITLKMLDDAPDVHTVCDHLWDWFQDMNLVPKKRLIPLAHNCQFDIPFIQHMLGYDQFEEIFGYPTRDTQALVTALQDKAAFKGQHIPFERAGLGKVCEILGVPLDDAHDALADAIATARCYKALLNLGAW